VLILPSDYKSIPCNKSELYVQNRVLTAVELSEDLTYEDLLDKIKDLCKNHSLNLSLFHQSHHLEIYY
jgi:hypothetical protein